MRRCCFDIESDGLLLDATNIWCICTKDLSNGETHGFGPDQLEAAAQYLQSFDQLVAHNGVMFDCPTVARLLGASLPPCVDTILISRLLYPDKKNNPIGGHSLEAWGNYLKCHKGKFSDWSRFSQEMLDYCHQDVEVTCRIWDYLLPQLRGWERAIKLEHQVARIITEQIQNGFTLDNRAVDDLYETLQQDRAVEMSKLAAVEGWYELREYKKPKYWVSLPRGPAGLSDASAYARKCDAPTNLRSTLSPGPPDFTVDHTPFNPASGDHIARLFIEQYGWQPKELTETGKPKTDKHVLAKLPYPEAKALTNIATIDNRLGFVNGWVEHQRDGRVHGDVITNGTVARRMAHMKPNMNVPKVKKDKNTKEIRKGFDGGYGWECRRCFTARPGWVLVGCDAAGLQERGLAHYMARWDGGEYARMMDKEESHQQWADALGCSRDDAKTVKYARIFGAGIAKQAQILKVSVATMKKKEMVLLNKIPALKHVQNWVAQQIQQNGYILGLDGAHLPVRSQHMALASLLQGFEAVVMKQALVFFYEQATIVAGPHRKEWALCVNVHDEQEFECLPKWGEPLGQLFAECITKSGEHFDLQVKLKGEYHVGHHWGEVH